MRKTERTSDRAKDEQHQQTRYQAEALTALANLAADLQELTNNEASPNVIIARIQTATALAGLTQTNTAGETVAYNPTEHEPYAGETITHGTPVEVIRPGYRLGTTTICRAQVITTHP